MSKYVEIKEHPNDTCEEFPDGWYILKSSADDTHVMRFLVLSGLSFEYDNQNGTYIWGENVAASKATNYLTYKSKKKEMCKLYSIFYKKRTTKLGQIL